MSGGDDDLYSALVEDRLTAEQRKRLMFDPHCLHACTVRFKWRNGIGSLRRRRSRGSRTFAGGMG